MIDWRIIETDYRAGVTEAGSRVSLRQTSRGWWAWTLILPGGSRVTGAPEPTPENAARAAQIEESDHLV